MVIGVIGIADGVTLLAGDCHRRAVPAGIIGVTLRQRARLGLMDQTVQAVIDIARDRAAGSRLCLLTAAGVVGICVRRNDALFVAVFEQNHPVRLVIAVRFSRSVPGYESLQCFLRCLVASDY